MSEKTEQPTAKRLREAMEKGQVAKSKDFTQTVLVVAIFGYMIANGHGLVESFGRMVLLPASLHGIGFADAMRIAGAGVLREAALMMLPFLLIVLVLGAFAELLQTGIIFAFKALAPSLEKISPAANAKNMFSAKNLMEFVKSLLKVLFLSVLIYVMVRGSIGPLMKIPLAGVSGVGEAVGVLMKQLIVYVAIAYVVISGFDFLFQRHQWIKGLMMSKDEVHREYKEMEGDPHVKGHRRQLAQEIAMGGMTENARKASVVVTNPTHLAVAIRYEEGETPLPLVLAKGENLVAERIVRIAREEGIPVMQNVPLARALHEHAQLDQYVPADLLEPVAEVLKLVRELRRREGEAT